MALRIRILMAVAALVVLFGFTLAGSVSVSHADDGWSWDDPVVQINGQQISIDLGVQGSASLVGAARVVITVPDGVSSRLIQSSSIFPTRVVFATAHTTWSHGQPLPITVSTLIKSTTPTQTGVRVMHYHGAQIGSAAGAAGSVLTTSFSLR